MSFKTDGFLAEDWQNFAKRNLVAPDESSLSRKLNRSIQKLLSEVSISNAVSPSDYRIVARSLLVRSLTNFQGTVILAEKGLGVEARTLARSCLETTFCLASVLTKKINLLIS